MMNLSNEDKDVMPERLMVDPPEGWRFGFPKEFEGYRRTGGLPFNIERWLQVNGYPLEEIQRWPEGVPVRYWTEKTPDVSQTNR